MSGRFDYVKYDETAQAKQAEFKSAFEALDATVDGLANGRAKSLAITRLEEAAGTRPIGRSGGNE